MSQVQCLRFTLLAALSLVAGLALTGCSGKDLPAKVEFTEQERQQVQDLNKQRTDEWGRRIN